MDRIDNVIPVVLQVQHSVSQEVSGSSLNRRLEDTTTNQGISGPLPSVGVLGMHCNAELFATPWCGEQLELWPLPADKPA